MKIIDLIGEKVDSREVNNYIIKYPKCDGTQGSVTLRPNYNTLTITKCKPLDVVSFIGKIWWDGKEIRGDPIE